MRLLGSYCNRVEAALRTKKLLEKARSEHVERGTPPAPSRRPAKKVTQVTHDALVEAYQAGMRHVDVARTFNLDPATVTKHLKLAGVERRTRSMNEMQKAEAKRLFAHGLTVEQISKQLGFAWRTIKNAVED